MAIESADDRAVFFDTDDFGTAATVDGSSVDGIFDHEYVEAAGIAGERPVFLCRTSDISAVALDVTVVVNSTNYTLRVIESDGTGLSRLILEEA